MNDLKIGVIGSGGRGRLAAHAHQPDQGSRVVACCDVNAATLQANREKYGDVFTTSDYRELLARDLDAVFITVPDFLHEDYACAALRAGKAVYLEKPMAITTEGCDRILRTAFETKMRLYLGHNMRHMPFVLKMKELIDAGALGEVKAVWCRHFVGHGGDFYFRDWHAERRYSTGLLLQKATHDIDVMHWLAGGYSDLVNALGGLMVYGDIQDRLPRLSEPRPLARPQIRMEVWPPTAQRELNADIDVEDLSLLQMRLDNGVFAAYQQCHFAPDYWRNYTVIGTAGRIENFGDGDDGTVVKLWNRRKRGWAEADEIFETSATSGGHGGADPRIVAEFLRFVREGSKTNTSPLAARQSVAAGCAATHSLRHGGIPVAVMPVDAQLANYFENGQA
ncbi:MAG: Gfo/Idh/MocA family oxidoreductase [Armatimonadota bacterium]|nr:Gfo/Idh/MocA family oxidoreductase [Armatimonadota bacterium]